MKGGAREKTTTPGGPHEKECLEKEKPQERGPERERFLGKGPARQGDRCSEEARLEALEVLTRPY